MDLHQSGDTAMETNFNTGPAPGGIFVLIKCDNGYHIAKLESNPCFWVDGNISSCHGWMPLPK